ncbi:unnamed protein product [Closterium sp. Naga37s-1]|nr:unnamed protein product [Closterium sp. Naga37s-1]
MGVMAARPTAFPSAVQLASAYHRRAQLSTSRGISIGGRTRISTGVTSGCRSIRDGRIGRVSTDRRIGNGGRGDTRRRTRESRTVAAAAAGEAAGEDAAGGKEAGERRMGGGDAASGDSSGHGGAMEFPVFCVQWAVLPGASDSLHIFMPHYVLIMRPSHPPFHPPFYPPSHTPPHPPNPPSTLLRPHESFFLLLQQPHSTISPLPTSLTRSV